ncbi:putative snare protein [Massarina eburnea CBS 473.64]|uniref:Synaptobrevin homolog YKT6 n=1 Tax=Massarina eburnea CBS 473.64 TaxID=1395130 RepID=A0A6A6SA12_9PLEO|nr:putative snare protein [Massarina eburnea CBS 473.64]
MKVVYIGILKNESKPAFELSAERNLKGFNYFTQNTVSQFMTFFAAQIAEKTEPGVRQDFVDEERAPDSVFHAYGRTEGVCGIIVTDKEYPSVVAQGLLSKVCDEFVAKYPRTAYTSLQPPAKFASESLLAFPELKDYIVKYQDPKQADNIMKIQQELDDTKQVLHKTIESVLERGEKIDNLVAKSDGLSAQSKMFYTQAKKQNSCCTVM